MYASTEQSKHARVQSLAEELYQERKPELMGIALSNAPSQADAEEALQEALTLFITHFDPHGPAPALPWLILTLKRACWSKRRIRPSVSLDTAAEDAGCGNLQAVLSSEVDGEFSDRIEDKLDTRDAMTTLKADERTPRLRLLLQGDRTDTRLDPNEGQPLHRRGSRLLPHI